MTTARKATNRSPTRERVSAESVTAGGYHPPMSLGDYDGEDGLRDPDFESQEQTALRSMDPGEPDGDPKPLYKIFPR